MNRFGDMLRQARVQCTDPDEGKALTQQRLGELLGIELDDHGFSGAAVSDWERGKSQIHKDNRAVLLALIRILHRCGGLQNSKNADHFLEAGNYRPLDTGEKEQLFPEETLSSRECLQQSGARKLFTQLREEIFPKYTHPQFNWPESLLGGLGKFSQHWSSEHALQSLLWIGIYWLTWKLAFPLLQWPFTGEQQARAAAAAYIAGAIIVPLLAAALVRTKTNPFWQTQHLDTRWQLRFYTHLGASLGFHVGYMLIFLLALVWFSLQLSPPPHWVALLGASWPVILSFAAARQIPVNMWRAYGRLSVQDRAIFSISFFYGPAFGLFFYHFFPYLLSPTLGIPLILTAMIGLTALLAWQKQRGRGYIPAHIWAVIYGVPWLLFEINQGVGVYGVTATACLLAVLIWAWSRGAVCFTFKGCVGFFVISGLLLLSFQVNLWIGRVAVLGALLFWWIKGKDYLRFPLEFWGTFAAVISTGLLLQYRLVSPVQAAGLVISITLIAIGMRIWRNSKSNQG